MKTINNFTKYRLLVLEDIRNDPFFFKRNNLLRYKIPKENETLDNKSRAEKVIAVWDLRNMGAFNITNDHPHLGGLNYEFYLEILHPEFEHIHEKIREGIYIKIIEKPSDWGWVDKIKGIYQFGKIPFEQTGGIRKEMFTALMDTFEQTPQAISIQTLYEMTNIDPPRIRIEIKAINTRLKVKVGIYFKGSGKGFYTLEKLPSSIPLFIQ